MAEILVSPGISITETDQSAYAARPLVAGAALIGPTVKGQPFVPTRVTSYGDFTRRFGTVFELEENGAKVQQEFLTSMAAKSYFEQGGDSILVVRVAPEGYFTGADSTTIRNAEAQAAADSASVAKAAADKAAEDVAAAEAAVVEAEENVEAAQVAVNDAQAADDAAQVAVDNAQAAYDADPTTEKQEALDEAKAAKEVTAAALVAANDAKTAADEAKVEADNAKTAADEAKTAADNAYAEAKAASEAADAKAPFVLKTLSCGKFLNGAASETYDASVDERADGSLVSGSSDNLRFEISNVDASTGTFSLAIRRGDDTAKDKTVLESFTNLSLDPNSVNYIAKKIGDQHAVIAYDDDQVPYVDVQGNYTNKSAYVYVAEIRDTLNYLCTDGETINKDLDGNSFDTYLPGEQVGAFYGAEGEVGKNPNMGEGDVADYFENITKASKFPQAVAPSDYSTAIALLENMDEYQFNVLSAPGVLSVDVNAKLIALSEDRGDNISVVDLSDCDDSTKQAAEDAMAQNSSYAATYYPWLQMYSSTGRLVWVPASVVIPGVYVYNDKQAAPWYAPAGMLRGGIQGVVQTRKKLTKAHRDTLYKKNVNPIATFPGSGIVIYGQKTLQKKTSALDRVNARRLLIELKKTVREMASHLLFEHNTASVRNSFRAKLEPYLESVVQRNGLYAYKVVIDELNDADTIDRNEFRCQIYVQPTKVIEFIYIDFTITATGVEFNS